jgi:hypothetical protein
MSLRVPPSICGAKSGDYSTALDEIVCELPAGHSEPEHGAYVWHGWREDEPEPGGRPPTAEEAAALRRMASDTLGGVS